MVMNTSSVYVINGYFYDRVVMIINACMMLVGIRAGSGYKYQDRVEFSGINDEPGVRQSLVLSSLHNFLLNCYS